MNGRAVLHAEWPAPRGVRAFTTLRYGCGISQPPFDTFNLGNRDAVGSDDPQAVARNRAMLVAEAGLPSAPHWLKQVHGIDVIRFEAPAASDASEPVADAAATSTPGVVLSVLTADCLPVVFAAEGGDEIAVAHAGWRGLAAGVLESTLVAMGTPTADVMVWLGPAAGPQAYEIGEEVYRAFTDREPRASAAFMPTRPGHWRVNLYALARMRLADAGVRRFFGGDLCTISDPRRFFSHRRDARTGRMATVVWIEGAEHGRR